jgi:formylglycine-generating enzyme required for sulfatase activity
MATSILVDYAMDNPDLLADLLMDADQKAYAMLFPAVKQHEARALSLFGAEMAQKPRTESADLLLEPTVGPERLARRKANAAIALLRLSQPEAVWPWLAASPDPRVRALLSDQSIRFGVRADLLAERLAVERDPVVRQAVLLALGDLRPALAPGKLPEQVAHLYATDPSPAVHSGAEWLLRCWGRDDELRMIDSSLKSTAHGGWSVNSQGQTMVIVPSPVTFRMGPPASQTHRHSDETPHHRHIGRAFAIAAHETTVAQFLKFRPDLPYDHRISPARDGPIVNVNWYEALKYCRWLSDMEHIPEEQMCYPRLEQIGPGMVLPNDLLRRTAYRLPTEAEWEYACGAQTATGWSFGDSDDLLHSYAWLVTNSSVFVHPVGRLRPNQFGLFDLHGNASEWCQTPHTPHPATAVGEVVEDEDFGSVTDADSRRELRGGHYREISSFTRTSARAALEAKNHYSYTGFRVARTVPH